MDKLKAFEDFCDSLLVDNIAVESEVEVPEKEEESEAYLSKAKESVIALKDETLGLIAAREAKATEDHDEKSLKECRALRDAVEKICSKNGDNITDDNVEDIAKKFKAINICVSSVAEELITTPFITEALEAIEGYAVIDSYNDGTYDDIIDVALESISVEIEFMINRAARDENLEILEMINSIGTEGATDTVLEDSKWNLSHTIRSIENDVLAIDRLIQSSGRYEEKMAEFKTKCISYRDKFKEDLKKYTAAIKAIGNGNQSEESGKAFTKKDSFDAINSHASIVDSLKEEYDKKSNEILEECKRAREKHPAAASFSNIELDIEKAFESIENPDKAMESIEDNNINYMDISAFRDSVSEFCKYELIAAMEAYDIAMENILKKKFSAFHREIAAKDSMNNLAGKKDILSSAKSAIADVRRQGNDNAKEYARYRADGTANASKEKIALGERGIKDLERALLSIQNASTEDELNRAKNRFEIVLRTTQSQMSSVMKSVAAKNNRVIEKRKQAALKQGAATTGNTRQKIGKYMEEKFGASRLSSSLQVSGENANAKAQAKRKALQTTGRYNGNVSDSDIEEIGLKRHETRQANKTSKKVVAARNSILNKYSITMPDYQVRMKQLKAEKDFIKSSNDPASKAALDKITAEEKELKAKISALENELRDADIPDTDKVAEVKKNVTAEVKNRKGEYAPKKKPTVKETDSKKDVSPKPVKQPRVVSKKEEVPVETPLTKTKDEAKAEGKDTVDQTKREMRDAKQKAKNTAKLKELDAQIQALQAKKTRYEENMTDESDNPDQVKKWKGLRAQVLRELGKLKKEREALATPAAASYIGETTDEVAMEASYNGFVESAGISRSAADSIKREIESIDLDIESVKNEIDDIKREINEIKSKADAPEFANSPDRLERELEKRNRKISDLNDKIEKYEKHKADRQKRYDYMVQHATREAYISYLESDEAFEAYLDSQGFTTEALESMTNDQYDAFIEYVADILLEEDIASSACEGLSDWFKSLFGEGRKKRMEEEAEKDIAEKKKLIEELKQMHKKYEQEAITARGKFETNLKSLQDSTKKALDVDSKLLERKYTKMTDRSNDDKKKRKFFGLDFRKDIDAVKEKLLLLEKDDNFYDIPLKKLRKEAEKMESDLQKSSSKAINALRKQNERLENNRHVIRRNAEVKANMDKLHEDAIKMNDALADDYGRTLQKSAAQRKKYVEASKMLRERMKNREKPATASYTLDIDALLAMSAEEYDNYVIASEAYTMIKYFDLDTDSGIDEAFESLLINMIFDEDSELYGELYSEYLPEIAEEGIFSDAITSLKKIDVKEIGNEISNVLDSILEKIIVFLHSSALAFKKATLNEEVMDDVLNYLDEAIKTDVIKNLENGKVDSLNDEKAVAALERTLRNQIAFGSKKYFNPETYTKDTEKFGKYAIAKVNNVYVKKLHEFTAKLNKARNTIKKNSDKIETDMVVRRTCNMLTVYSSFIMRLFDCAITSDNEMTPNRVVSM